jgi:carboxylate-amine ligase
MSIEITMGVEEEVFLLHKDNTPYLLSETGLLEALGLDGVSASKEFHVNMLETQTAIESDIDSLVESMVNIRSLVVRRALALAPECKLQYVGTDPYNNWEQVPINNGRYQDLDNEYVGILRRMYTSGMHMHLGLPTEHLAAVFNKLRNFIPFIIAASANSPYFDTKKTGMACTRMVRNREMPNSGIPPKIECIRAHNAALMRLEKSISQSVHDIRFSIKYGTLEVRCIDTQLDSRAASAMAVLIYVLARHCLVQSSSQWKDVDPLLLDEARWKACRNGRSFKLASPILGMISFDEFSRFIVKLTLEYAEKHAELLQWFLFDYAGGAEVSKNEV